MKFVYPKINYVFDTDDGVNVIIIENPTLLYQMLQDIQSQIDGNDGLCVVSEKNKSLAFPKYVELMTQFIPFDLNQKSLITKMNAKLEKIAVDDQFYERTMALMTDIEKYLYDVSFDMTANITFSKVNAGSIIKASGLEIVEDYDNLGEKIIDYMELIVEYDRQKLFVFLNLRSFLSVNETEAFFDTILKHGYHVIMIENCEKEKLSREIRYIVDSDLCEIK